MDRIRSSAHPYSPTFEHLCNQIQDASARDILRRSDERSHAIVNAGAVLWINPLQQIPKRHRITRPSRTENGRECRGPDTLVASRIECQQRRAETLARIFIIWCA